VVNETVVKGDEGGSVSVCWSAFHRMGEVFFTRRDRRVDTMGYRRTKFEHDTETAKKD